MKVAVINRHSPQDVRTALRSHISVIGTSFSKLRIFLSDYLGNGVEFDAGGFSMNVDAGGLQAMDVGALFKGVKGYRGKEKGKFGKSVPKIAGVCNLCGKTGHKKDECWFKDSKG